ncbi:MAG: site-specific integrase [Prolixibacteraceae bacterium]|nr:site-specific integrase [Prolixibacteraceae bacterium]
MKLKATTAIILDTRREKNNGTYPVKVRVTYDQRYKKYGTKYALNEDDYETITSKNFRSEKLRNIKAALDKIKVNADEVISGIEEFNFDEFENIFLEKRGDMTNIINAFDAIVVQKKESGRIGTAIGYEYAKKSLQEFEKYQLNLKKTDEVDTLQFKKITVNYLNEYDKWMRSEGKTATTIGMYLRNVRALMNTAVKTNVIKSNAYPFGVGKYEIPTSNSIKKALSNEELKKLFEYQPKAGSPEHYFFDLWLFSYLCNGLNIKDILRLKYSNIQGESIIFVRAKTEHTTKQRTEIEAILTPIAKQIIDRWGTKPVQSDNFIFPFLNKEMTADKQHKVKEQAVWQINKYIKKVAAKVGIDAKLTTYVARHSYTSKLLRAGISIEFLRQQLGHTDSKTTLNYAQKIDFDTKQKATNLLTEF